MSFRDRPVEVLSAFDAAQAREVLEANPDTALILLDVVMEREDAGLELVRTIREEMSNHLVRIVLRTGQPGSAPEEKVVLNYDINDYKEKTELTARKLFTTVVASLRAYDDLLSLEINRRGLDKILASSDSLFKLRSLRTFAEGVLTQLGAVIGIGPDGILCVQRVSGTREVTILAGAGRYDGLDAKALEDLAGEKRLVEGVGQALAEKANVHESDYSALYFSLSDGREMVAFLDSGRPVSEVGRRLLEVFTSKIAVGFDNITLFEQLKVAKQELEVRVRERTRELTEANERLAELAVRDPLTGAFNRRHFTERAAEEISEARRHDRRLSLLMVDLDHFKLVNDTHGHAVGDEVLGLFVELAVAEKREEDILGRFGGEEFVLLLPGTGVEGAREIGERLREAVAGREIVPQGVEGFSITVSVGCAELSAADEGFEAVLRRADAAMYEAKRQGRNAVVCREAG